MINRNLKQYLSGEFIARHEIAAAKIRHLFGDPGMEFVTPISFPKLGLDFFALNISAFRHLDIAQAASVLGSPVATFRSSGSTNQGRSVSSFSHVGLECYKKAITSGFYRILGHYGIEKAPGVSLIPERHIWSESSLACMISWISENKDVLYLSTASKRRDFEKIVHKNGWLNNSSAEPLWLFGTTFHFLPLLDRGEIPPLPGASVIFYTGGTKGKTRDISEAAFLSKLVAATKLDPGQIVSEYGMSELASVAYSVPRSPGWFEFQAGAIPFVIPVDQAHVQARGRGPENRRPLFTGSFSGTGILGVFDFNRVDIPLPILTEDVVELKQSGKFQLLGRAFTAPLKGCSMFVHEVASSDRLPPKPPSTPDAQIYRTNRTTRAPIRAIANFCQSEAACELLANYLLSKTAAKMALCDLWIAANQLLKNKDALEQAITRSEISNCGPRFLVIAPNSHPVAIIYPLALILATNRSVTIRLTRNQLGNSFTKLLVETLRVHGAEIDLVSPEFRLDENSTPGERLPWDDMVLFGSTETTEKLVRITGKNIRPHTHGDAVTVSYCPEKELVSNLPAILRDTFSLMQQGCMSSRLLVITPEDPNQALSEHFEKIEPLFYSIWQSHWREPLDVKRRAGILLKNMATGIGESRASAFHTSSQAVPRLEISTCNALVNFGPQLKISVLPGEDNVEHFFRNLKCTWPTIKLITCPSSWHERLHIEGCEIRKLGYANQPRWDGYHFGKPLFPNC